MGKEYRGRATGDARACESVGVVSEAVRVRGVSDVRERTGKGLGWVFVRGMRELCAVLRDSLSSSYHIRFKGTPHPTVRMAGTGGGRVSSCLSPNQLEAG